MLSGSTFFSMLLISYFTYSYQLVLMIIVLFITILSVLIAKKRQNKVVLLELSVDENCAIAFNDTNSNVEGSGHDKQERFQLLASSRYSFIGCWLHMAPLSNNDSLEFFPNSIFKSSNQKLLFIYRDSLSSEDFSRLSLIIRKLRDDS